MKFKIWQFEWGAGGYANNRIFVSSIQKYGVDIIQNGSPGLGVGTTPFAAHLASQAGLAAEFGMEYDLYIRCYNDTCTPAMLASVTSWPSNLSRIMADSENEDLSDYSAWLAEIPESIAFCHPEPHPGMESYAEYDHAGPNHDTWHQKWCRVTGWTHDGTNDCRRVTDIGGACYVEQAYTGVSEFFAGAQAYDDTYALADTPAGPLRASIYLVAQATAGQAHGVHWGVTKGITDDTWEAMDLAYRTVNLCDWSDLTPVAADVAVLLSEPSSCYWYGMQKLWEMIIRLSVPADVLFIDDITAATLANYKALYIPKLDSNRWPSGYTADQRSAILDYADRNEAGVAKDGCPVFCQCGDASWYGGAGGAPTIPLFARVLPSSRAHRDPAEVYPSLDGFSGYEVADDWHYDERMALMMSQHEDQLVAAGVTPPDVAYDIARRSFRRGTRAVTIDVDLALGTMTFTEGGVIIPPPGPIPPPPSPRGRTLIKGNAFDRKEWERNWRLLRKYFPDSTISSSTRRMEDHERNARKWKREHPTSASDSNARSAVEIRRGFQAIAKETEV